MNDREAAHIESVKGSSAAGAPSASRVSSAQAAHANAPDIIPSAAEPIAFRSTGTSANESTAPATEGAHPDLLSARHGPPVRRGTLLGTAVGQVAASLARLTLVALFVITFLAQPTQIPSGSMENTLLTGDLVLVNKQVFADPGRWGWLLPYRTPHVGSLVVFHYPVDPGQLLVKRVVAVGGDRIHLLNNTLYRNGVPQVEPYAQYTDAARSPYRDRFPNLQEADPSAQAAWWIELRGRMRGGELPMPPGHYFVMGDNRNNSLDSRFWGLVTPAAIVGEPLLTYLSVEREEGKPPRLRRERLLHVIR